MLHSGLEAFLIVWFSLWLATPAIAEDKSVNFSINMWKRGRGNHEMKAIEKAYLVSFSPLNKKLKIRERSLYDPQYEKTRTYRGVYLTEILKQYAVDLGDNDAYLLHFNNGMMIPLEIKNPIKNKVFIATAFLDKESKSQWSQEFPNMEKKDEIRYFRDPNPTKFKGNKVVVPLSKNQLYFKDKKGKLVARFTPWMHVSSLTGIEFINLKRYQNQFNISSSTDLKRGYSVFSSRCQYCHGVKGVGASFGWEFGGPIKISKKRNSEGLHLFVKYPKADSLQMGLKMPNQIDLKPEDTDSLWKWIEAVESKPLKAY